MEEKDLQTQKEKEARQKELAEKVKKKRIRKYALMALVAVIVISTAIGFSIEGKDAKLEDGQGNIVIGSQVDQPGDADVQTPENDADTDVSDDSDAQTPDEDPTDADKPDQDNTDKPDADKNDKPDKDDPPHITDDGKDVNDMTDEEKAEVDAEDIKVDSSDDPTASNGGNAALRPETPEPVTVTMEIRCDNLSQNMDKLENEAIRDYIPEDGVILAKSTYSGTTDNTVFDALNTLCRNNDIQLEFSYTPIFASYYIEGINFLYEFDGGAMSGWMYKVNDWFPNYGCSSYYLRDGDHIVWCYTLDYGADVGDNSMAS